jgi:hypothetical protein
VTESAKPYEALTLQTQQLIDAGIFAVGLIEIQKRSLTEEAALSAEDAIKMVSELRVLFAYDIQKLQPNVFNWRKDGANIINVPVFFCASNPDWSGNPFFAQLVNSLGNLPYPENPARSAAGKSGNAR